MDNEGILKLVAKDKTVVEVSSKAAKRSKFICDLLADFKDEEIQVAEADGNTLQEIVEYLEHYKDSEPRAVPKPMEETQRLKDIVDKWDVEFAEKSDNIQRLQDLIVAADYMGINSLHELMCAKLACIMLDLGTAEKIIEHFNIDEDMTEEEQRQMEREELEDLKKQRQEEFNRRREKQEEEYKNQHNVENQDDEENLC